MENKKSTRKALLFNALSLLVCLCMFIGSTFAWFTDSATSGLNKIQSGNLKMDLELLDKDTNEWNSIKESSAPIFNYTLWEPGYMDAKVLKIENEGTLALKWVAELQSDVELSELADVIDVYVCPSKTELSYPSDRSLDGYTKVGTVSEFVNTIKETTNGYLLAGEDEYLGIVLKMQETAGNEYQDLDLGGEFDIVIRAAQYAYEEDSFNKTYDENAEYGLTEKEEYIKDNGVATVNGRYFLDITSAFKAAKDGDTVELINESINTQDNQLTETIVVDKDITLIPNGMYLVSSADATFTVKESGKLKVEEGSFTIKNTSANGTAVLVDGGEFEMAGGSFDAYSAVKTTEGKSSTVTLSAGWSNRVTVGFDSKGNDTINVKGGSLYTKNEVIKTTAGTHVTINMTGGTLSSGATQYSSAVQLNGTATVNMSGGTIANTYQSGLNGSSAIAAFSAPTTIQLSGNAQLTSKGTTVILGSHRTSPQVLAERFVFEMSGNSKVTATGDVGFGIRYAQDACDVVISENAQVDAAFHAIQFNSNSYVFENSTLLIKDNVKITSKAGRYGGGYAIAANGNVTITGGTISGSTSGLEVTQPQSVVVIDNSTTNTPISINIVKIAEGTNYTVLGNPSLG